jgi:hypothetical protein
VKFAIKIQSVVQHNTGALYAKHLSLNCVESDASCLHRRMRLHEEDAARMHVVWWKVCQLKSHFRILQAFDFMESDI